MQLEPHCRKLYYTLGKLATLLRPLSRNQGQRVTLLVTYPNPSYTKEQATNGIRTLVALGYFSDALIVGMRE